MKKVIVLFDEQYDDVDILSVPKRIAENINDHGQSYCRWLESPDVDPNLLKVVNGVKGKKKRRRKGYRRILNRVAEHSDKKGVRKVINYHNQRGKHRRKRKSKSRFWNRRAFKNFCFTYCHKKPRNEKIKSRKAPF